MSNPPNVLDKYRTFSYQHFVVVANNTEAIRQLQTGSLSFASLAALTHGQSINSTSTPSSTGAAIVMAINSETDSAFYIDSLTFATSFLGMEAGKSLTLASDMKMVVKEVGGATFLNFLRTLVDSTLQTGLSGSCFLLKTFFVGHRDDGGVDRTEVAPIAFNITNIDSAFDHTGGTHNLECTCLGNGAPLQDPGLLYVNRNLNLVTNDNSILLKDLITDLQNKLNAQLTAQYNAVQAATNNGRQVNYKITIPDDWAAYTVKCTTKDNYVEALFPKEQQAVATTANPVANSTQTSTPSDDRFKSSINTNVQVTVVQILSEIFKHCDQIHEALVNNSNLKAGEMPKLHQVITSITSDEKLMTVHFDVVNYYLPKISSAKTDNVVVNQTKTTTTTPTGTTTSAPGQTNANGDKATRTALEAQFGIVFDFIFTGKNTDIITFDIKANMVNLFVQNNRPGANTAITGSVKTASADPTQVKSTDKQTSGINTIRKYDPVTLPMLSAEQQQGYVYAAPDSADLRNQYTQKLALAVAIAAQSGHLTIRGNPAFLNQLIQPLMPHNDSDYQTALAKRAADAKAAATQKTGTFDPTKSTSFMGINNASIPLLIKINIFMPKLDGSAGYEQFFYNGYYQVLRCENKFANGEFTQDLQLNPYDTADLTDNSRPVSKVTE